MRSKTRPIRILVTAGPTIEPIDPVRFMSNRSTGFLGYEIAGLARKRKYQVTLISGPVNILPPPGVKFIKIETARELHQRVHLELKRADVLVMSSAVSDFKPKFFHKRKIKSKKEFGIRLVKNPDILGSIRPAERKGKIIVGFSLETDNLLANSIRKRIDKRADLMIANKLDGENTPFGGGRKTVYLIDRLGRVKKLKNITKPHIACAILDTIEELCYTPV
ncbi:MAG: hypothetical protein JW994_05005 [Candidatus Omnitrophica bacterium]|nr:hypothetical protein [Candidatus Omnitrophota bacterium]